MAQKAAKSLAVRNAAKLKQFHLFSLAAHGFFLLSKLLRLHSMSTRSFGVYILLSTPAALIELWFERNSRPKLNATGDLVAAGDDLDAKGLTEYFHDILYWTWFTVVAAAAFGNRALWLYAIVPLYSIYAAFKAYGGVKDAMGGLAGAGAQSGEGSAGGQSNRQRKLEKRGGQKVQYR